MYCKQGTDRSSFVSYWGGGGGSGGAEVSRLTETLGVGQTLLPTEPARIAQMTVLDLHTPGQVRVGALHYKHRRISPG